MELLLEIKELRKAQRNYYTFRKGMESKKYLEASKQLETKLDSSLKLKAASVTHNDAHETILVKAYTDMRRKQKKYYTNIQSAWHYQFLAKAKNAEKYLDMLIVEIEVKRIQIPLL